MSEGMTDPAAVGTNGSAGSSATPPAGDDHVTRFLEDTLASVLRSAQESAAEMMERARKASEDEAAVARHLREEARQQVERMATWSAQVEPLVMAANTKASIIRTSVADVPARMAEALLPLNAALSDME